MDFSFIEPSLPMQYPNLRRSKNGKIPEIPPFPDHATLDEGVHTHFGV